MSRVALALVPGLGLQLLMFGPGVALQIATCVATAWGLARLRQFRAAPGQFPAMDWPGLVTALLIAAALPPLTPWWVGVFATATALLLARDAYGGTGANLFNPAMAGYAATLVAFPAEMSRWSTDAPLWSTFQGWAGSVPADGITAATTLEVLRFTAGATEAELFASDGRFGTVGGAGWEWIAVGWVVGGGWLLFQRIIHWHAPAGLLLGLAAAASIGADAGSSSGHGSPLFHWFTGGAMLAAFFIATDPVTSPMARWHQFWFGVTIGVTTWLIRAYGHYPDGVAFAVLLGNALVPLWDRLPASLSLRRRKQDSPHA